jgi:hypothetical protein
MMLRYQIGFQFCEHLDAEVNATCWETVRDKIKISTKKSLVYYEEA